MAENRLSELARKSQEELEQVFKSGTMPEPEALVGWEFNGHNTPWWARYAGIFKFKKGFFRIDAGRTPLYRGYNIPVVQNELSEPWICKPTDEEPKRFGFYAVHPAKAARTLGDARRHPNALMLDYAAAPENLFFDPSRVLKDYLVQVNPGSSDLLLGRAYLTLGPARVFSNFFILERDRRSDFAGS